MCLCTKLPKPGKGDAAEKSRRRSRTGGSAAALSPRSRRSRSGGRGRGYRQPHGAEAGPRPRRNDAAGHWRAPGGKGPPRPGSGGEAAMGRAVSVAACALNQWALDFEGNLERIFRSEWGGGGGTGFAPRAPGSSSAGARWLPPPPRLQAVGKRLLPPRVSGRGGSGDRACFMRSGSPGPAAGGRLGRAGWAGPGLSVRRAFNPTVLPGIDIAKRRGARYRLGPELEIW